MLWAFGVLLRLYPKDQPESFAGEMRAVFRQAADEYRDRAWPAYAWFVLRELIGLVWGAGAQWRITWQRNGSGLLRTAIAISGGTVVAALGQMILYQTLLPMAHFGR